MMENEPMDPIRYFALLIQQDDAIPLFEAAASLAHAVMPTLDLTSVQNEADILAARLQRRLASDTAPIRKLQLLNHFFYQECGFGGNFNHYYDPDNSYLHRVFATRRGIPISLAVIYMELARQVGLEVKGVSFPGHFLMRLSVQSGDIVLDPMNGTSLSLDELEERLTPYFVNPDTPPAKSIGGYLAAAHPRDILVRMLHNLKSIHLENQRWEEMLDVQQRLVLLLPDDMTERRNRGLTYAKLNCPQAAVSDLEVYLASRPDAPDADTIRHQLASLRNASRRLN